MINNIIPVFIENGTYVLSDAVKFMTCPSLRTLVLESSFENVIKELQQKLSLMLL